MKNSRIIAGVAFFILAAFLGYLVVESDYDLQALKLTFLRVNLWFLVAVYYVRLKSLLEDDDIEQDWDRINSGNVAVAIYRGLELGVVGIATAMLIAKI